MDREICVSKIGVPRRTAGKSLGLVSDYHAKAASILLEFRTPIQTLHFWLVLEQIVTQHSLQLAK